MAVSLVNHLRNRLRRLTVQLALVTALSILLSVIGYGWYMETRQSERAAEHLRAEAAIHARNIAAGVAGLLVVRDYVSVERLLLESANYAPVQGVLITDVKGLVISEVEHLGGRPPQARFRPMVMQLPTGRDGVSTLRAQSIVLWQPVVLGDVLGWVRITYSLDAVQALRSDIRRQTAIGAGAALVFGMLTLMVFLRPRIAALERIRQFSDTLDRRLGDTLEVSEQTVELASITRALNAASVRLRDSEAILQEAQRKFLDLAEHSPSVFWLQDATCTQLHYISPAYEVIWGRSCQSAYADPRYWLNAVHPDDWDRVAAEYATGTVSTRDLEYRIVRPDGTERWVRDRAFPVRDVDGLVRRVAGIATDISAERSAAEEARRHQEEKAIREALEWKNAQLVVAQREATEAVRVKSDVMSSVGHRMRTPLYSLSGFSRLLLSTPLSDEQREYVRCIHLATNGLLELVNGVSEASDERAGGASADLVVHSDAVDATPESPSTRHFFGMVVLVADDNEINRRLVALLLERAGANVVTVVNGQAALDAMRARTFDLVLLDLHMPGMSGVEVVAAARCLGGAWLHVPIVALTADAFAGGQRDLISAGFNALLVKPLSEEALWSELSRWVGTPQDEVRHATPATLPAVDAILGMRLAGGNAQTAQELLDMLLQSLPRHRALMDQAMLAGDMHGLYAEVHKLHGGTCYCGVPALREAAATLERALKQEDRPATQWGYATLCAEMERLVSCAKSLGTAHRE